jgi:hypothetical protein
LCCPAFAGIVEITIGKSSAPTPRLPVEVCMRPDPLNTKAVPLLGPSRVNIGQVLGAASPSSGNSWASSITRRLPFVHVQDSRAKVPAEPISQIHRLIHRCGGAKEAREADGRGSLTRTQGLP